MALASSSMPVIRQVYNSCGIASVLMVLKPDKNKELDAFLRNLEKKITKNLKLDPVRYDFLDRVQFAAAWLILHAVFKEPAILEMLAPSYPDIENFRPMLESRLDEMVVYQKAGNNARIEKDHARLIERGEITQNVLVSYVQEQKTDAELRLLGSMFGLVFKAVPEADGGTPLGTVAQVDPRHPEEYMKKVGLLVRQLEAGAVFANYEYHWLPLREIGTRIGQFVKEEKQIASASEISATPHYFKLNNPLSGTILSVTRLDILAKYIFYLYDFQLSQQRRILNLLKATLKL
ncbi:MAG: hypothetical protein Q6373_023855 [Candidatus Sigynarchaeota archaeon]